MIWLVGKVVEGIGYYYLFINYGVVGKGEVILYDEIYIYFDDGQIEMMVLFFFGKYKLMVQFVDGEYCFYGYMMVYGINIIVKQCL